MVDLPSSSWASPTDRYLVGPVQKKGLKEKSHLYKKQASIISSTFIYRIYISSTSSTLHVLCCINDAALLESLHHRDAASIGGSSRSSTKVTRMCSSGTLGMENCLRGLEHMPRLRVGVGLGLGLGGLDQYEHLKLEICNIFFFLLQNARCRNKKQLLGSTKLTMGPWF